MAPDALKLAGSPDALAGGSSKQADMMSRINGNRELKPLLTKQQLADWLQVSKKTIDRLEYDGQLPPAFVLERGRNGRRMKRWDADEVRQYLQRLKP